MSQTFKILSFPTWMRDLALGQASISWLLAGGKLGGWKQELWKRGPIFWQIWARGIVAEDRTEYLQAVRPARPLEGRVSKLDQCCLLLCSPNQGRGHHHRGPSDDGGLGLRLGGELHGQQGGLGDTPGERPEIAEAMFSSACEQNISLGLRRIAVRFATNPVPTKSPNMNLKPVLPGPPSLRLRQRSPCHKALP